MNLDQMVGAALVCTVVTVLALAMWAGSRQRSARVAKNEAAQQELSEQQAVVYSEETGRYAATVGGVFLSDWMGSGCVRLCGSNSPHHASHFEHRHMAERLLDQWNAQNLRSDMVRTTYAGHLSHEDLVGGETTHPVSAKHAEAQEIIYFEPIDRYAAMVNGAYLLQNRETGLVEPCHPGLPHTMTTHVDRDQVARMLGQWNSQKVRPHVVFMPYRSCEATATQASETQAIAHFESTGRYAALVNGCYLQRDGVTGFVRKCHEHAQHHLTTHEDRSFVEAMLDRWDAQKLRAPIVSMPYKPHAGPAS